MFDGSEDGLTENDGTMDGDFVMDGNSVGDAVGSSVTGFNVGEAVGASETGAADTGEAVMGESVTGRNGDDVSWLVGANMTGDVDGIVDVGGVFGVVS